MRTFEQVGPLRAYLRGLRAEGKSVGFVPTMGALHEGHLTLARRAKADCDLALVSIFVNPTQFGPNEDFDAYPRDMNHDQRLCSNEGVDALFAPSVEEIYPPGSLTFVEVAELGCALEGAQRPGHFRGVATVVSKLINIVHPNCIYFGQKDYQQVLVIERLARDLNLQLEIVPVPTVREPDGLALSSRNVHLSPEDRQAATVLSRALRLAERRIQEGERDAARLQRELETLIASESRATLDYVALVHPETLQPTPSVGETPTLVALAARFGRARLIDNSLIGPEGAPLTRPRLRLF